MKTRNFKHGKKIYRSYLKPVGKGYEVGFVFSGTPLFVGNFVHAKEANAWYTQMNQQIAQFTKKYWITPNAPRAFYNKFMTQHLYKIYYAFLDKHFAKYTRTYSREFNKNERKYKRLRKNWRPKDQLPLRRAA